MANKEAQQFGRLITASVTPFDDEGQLSIERTRRLARHLVDTGTESIVVSGTTGESPTLKERDRMLLLDAVLNEVGDQVRVIAGTGTNDTAESVHLSRLAQEAGARGLLLVTPYYNKPPQEGMRRHFATIADAVNIPCILYNVPSRTAVNLEPATVQRLDNDYENIVGLKEAYGMTPEGRAQLALIIEGKSKGFEVWSGNDQDTFYIMENGGYGVVSVASHAAGRLISQMIKHHVIGERNEAERMHNYLMPLYEHLFPPTSPYSSPAAVKAVCDIIGVPVGDFRLPLINVPEDYKQKLQVLVASYNLIPQGGEVK